MRWIFIFLLATLLCYGVIFVLGFVMDFFGAAPGPGWMNAVSIILYFPCAWAASKIIKLALADEA